MTKDILCIYHFPCVDGFTSAWVLNKYYKNDDINIEYHPTNYGEKAPIEKARGKFVYILDFSYSKEDMLKLEKVALGIVIIDHHTTAKDVVEPLIENIDLQLDGVFDMNKSGALLTWEWFNNSQDKRVPELVKYVSDRDLWKFELPWSKEFSMFLFSYDYTFENWDDISSCWEVSFDSYTAQGRAIMRKHDKDIIELCEQTQMKKFTLLGDCKKYPVVNLPYTMASDGCKYVAKMYQDEFQEQIGFSYYINKDGLYCFSIRASDDTDVSAIAKIYGGGGHKSASGFVVDKLPWEV